MAEKWVERTPPGIGNVSIQINTSDRQLMKVGHREVHSGHRKEMVAL